VVKVVAGVFSAATIVNADISAVAAIAVSKLQAGSAGQILMNNSTPTPTWTTLSFSGGGGSISSAGVITLPSSEIMTFDVTIPTASVLTMFDSPITLVGAQGAGLGIELISASASMTYEGVAYATNGIINILCQTATEHQALNNQGILFGTVTKTVIFTFNGVTGATATQIIANQPLIAQVGTGNPTAGNSDIRIQGLYRVISVPYC